MKILVTLLVMILYTFQNCTLPETKNIVLNHSTYEQKYVQNVQKQSVVFIAGIDNGNQAYYQNARNYFTDLGLQVVEKESLEEIIQWLANQHSGRAYDTIHIVSHSNPWYGISLKAKKDGARITAATLHDLKETVRLPLLDAYVNAATKIVIHACGVGQNKRLLQELQTAFTADEVPQLFASKYFTVFGGSFAGHYMAKPYFGFYPTAESPGPLALTKDLKAKYPKIEIDWRTALGSRSATQFGQAFTYAFNIPVTWEFHFDKQEKVPDVTNRDDLLDWIIQQETIATELFELGIAVEKYRWRSKVANNKLSVHGKTTVLCVLQPIMDPEAPAEYKTVHYNDTDLYQKI